MTMVETALAYAREELGHPDVKFINVIKRDRSALVLVDTEECCRFALLVEDGEVTNDSVPEFEFDRVAREEEERICRNRRAYGRIYG